MYFVFYSFFYFLEDSGLLNINCPFDLYALHFVFMPLIQRHLDNFRHGWAHHSLRTEHNKTPQQLWIMGLQNVGDHDNMAVAGLNVSVTVQSTLSSFLWKGVVNTWYNLYE